MHQKRKYDHQQDTLNGRKKIYKPDEWSLIEGVDNQLGVPDQTTKLYESNRLGIEKCQIHTPLNQGMMRLLVLCEGSSSDAL